MNISTNDSIRIVWRDSIENYKKSTENAILADAKKKYGTNKVNVIFEPINNATTTDVGGIRIDASSDVANPNYQIELAKKYINENKLLNGIKWEHFVKLDQSINAELSEEFNSTNLYKTIYVNKIEFVNFLSYGPKLNVIDYKTLNGITTVSSNPSNFGGKTTAILDAVLFLFFNKTTKTSVAADVFNENTDHNQVRVRGELVVDGVDYIIEREVNRREKRDGTYDIKQSLSYYQRLPDGGLRDLKGEERIQTEKVLTEYIGTYDDFLLTSLTKQDTLEDLIKAKPTERGRTFTRFVGLEIFREKEELAKRKHKEWLSSSLLKKHNVSEINEQITVNNGKIEEYENLITLKTREIEDNTSLLAEFEKERNDLLTTKHTDIDQTLMTKDIHEVNAGLEKLNASIATVKAKYDEHVKNLVEPTEVYNIDSYNVLNVRKIELTNEVNKLSGRVSYAESKIKDIDNSGICQFCSNDLSKTKYYVDAKATANDDKEQSEKELFIKESEMHDVMEQMGEMDSVRMLWDEYQKDCLQRDKYELELEKYDLSKKRGEDLLNNIRINSDKIQHNKNIEAQITKLDAKISLTRDSVNLAQMNVGKYKSDIEYLRSDIKRYETIIDQVKKDEYVDKLYTDYKTIYGKNGISKMVLGTLLPSINANLVELMVDSADFILEMDLNDKNEIEYYIIKHATGDKRRKLSKGSGYEKTISALALRTVLAKFCSLPRPQFVIFDEIFGAVAVENFDLIGAFFDKIKKYFDNIIIISHHPVVETWGDSYIHVQKVNEISEIV